MLDNPCWGARVRCFSAAFIALALLASWVGDAQAVLRGQSAGGISRHVVRLTGPGLLCSATVIGPREVLTAAHCVNNYRSLSVTAGGRRIAVTGASGGAPARLTLAQPLPSSYVPIAIGSGSGNFIIAGYGVAYESPRAPSAGLRQANLVSQNGSGSGPLIDPNRQGNIGASACMGDSGGPVAQFDGSQYVLVGIIDRASHPSPSRACGHLTHFVAAAGFLSGTIAAAPAPRPARRVANVKQQKQTRPVNDGIDPRDYR